MDDDEDTFRVSLTRNEQFGFGFSLLGVSGLPHVIFDIVESSPAELEEVSAVKSGFSVVPSASPCQSKLPSDCRDVIVVVGFQQHELVHLIIIRW